MSTDASGGNGRLMCRWFGHKFWSEPLTWWPTIYRCKRCGTRMANYQ